MVQNRGLLFDSGLRLQSATLQDRVRFANIVIGYALDVVDDWRFAVWGVKSGASLAFSVCQSLMEASDNLVMSSREHRD